MKYAIATGAGLALLLVSAGGAADLYQWVDPASRVRQLSGTPPAWYRGPGSGPRVKVFSHGQLIDDTAVRVSAEDAATLRNRALGTPAAPPPAPRAGTRPEETTIPAVVLPPPPPTATATPPPVSNASDLKALIDAWDRGREAQARAVLRDKLPAADARPAPEPPPSR